jgi:hypothetical protein
MKALRCLGSGETKSQTTAIKMAASNHFEIDSRVTMRNDLRHPGASVENRLNI